MTRVLVTGGAGFIGSHLAELLARRGHDVTVLDDLSGGFRENVPAGVRLVAASVVDHRTLDRLVDEIRPAVVFHLAAYAAEGLSHFIRRFNTMNNTVGSVNVINACVNYDVPRLVFTSSAAVYGYAQGELREDEIPRPADPYGIAKYAVEQELAAAHDLFGLEYAIIRPHNVYGPRQNIADRYRNAVGIFLNQAMQGLPLTVFGDGLQTRQFTFVDELVEVIAACGWREDLRNLTLNVGDDRATTLRRLAEMVLQVLDVDVPINFVEPRKEALHVDPSHERLHRLFPEWRSTPLEEGLARMAAWARSVGPRTPCVFEEIEIERELPPVWRRPAVGGGAG
jgi:UDP-glucose 4-epimerase